MISSDEAVTRVREAIERTGVEVVDVCVTSGQPGFGSGVITITINSGTDEDLHTVDEACIGLAIWAECGKVEWRDVRP